MSTATVVAPSGDSAPVVPLKGGAIVLSPAAVGGRRRGSKKMTKKMRKMLKALKKMKAGDVGDAVDTANMDESGLSSVQTEEGGRRRRRHTRRHRKSRRHYGLFA
jgi:hypothetical protein